jgi:hypothetical protein
MGTTPVSTIDVHCIEMSFENVTSASADGVFSGATDACSADLSPVPEPGGLALMLSGLAMLAWQGRRRVL